MNQTLIDKTQEFVDRAASENAIDRVFSELASVARASATSHRLARFLSDPEVPVESKQQFVNDIGGGRLHAISVDVLVQLPRRFRVQADGYAEVLADVVALLGFAAADRAGTLEAVENGLYGLAGIVRDNGELRSTLVNPGLMTNAKEALIADILGGKTDERVIELARVLVALRRGTDVDELADELSLAAAERRNMVVAHVRTAVPLDDDRRRALLESIERTVGKSIEGRFVVDPAIVGSVVVRVGDEVFDGSLRHRIEQARKELVGS